MHFLTTPHAAILTIPLVIAPLLRNHVYAKCVCVLKTLVSNSNDTFHLQVTWWAGGAPSYNAPSEWAVPSHRRQQCVCAVVAAVRQRNDDTAPAFNVPPA